MTITISSTTLSALPKPVMYTRYSSSLILKSLAFTWDASNDAPLTVTVIDAENAQLVLSSVSFTGIKMDALPLLTVPVQANSFVMEGTNEFTSITRAAPATNNVAGAVFQITLTASDTASIKNAHFTSCGIDAS